MTTIDPAKFYGSLPTEAQRALREAASAPVPPGDPNARVKAVDKARERIHLMYPEYFQEAKDGDPK